MDKVHRPCISEKILKPALGVFIACTFSVILGVIQLNILYTFSQKSYFFIRFR